MLISKCNIKAPNALAFNENINSERNRKKGNLSPSIVSMSIRPNEAVASLKLKKTKIEEQTTCAHCFIRKPTENIMVIMNSSEANPPKAISIEFVIRKPNELIKCIWRNFIKTNENKKKKQNKTCF